MEIFSQSQVLWFITYSSNSPARAMESLLVREKENVVLHSPNCFASKKHAEKRK